MNLRTQTNLLERPELYHRLDLLMSRRTRIEYIIRMSRQCSDPSRRALSFNSIEWRRKMMKLLRRSLKWHPPMLPTTFVSHQPRVIQTLQTTLDANGY